MPTRSRIDLKCTADTGTFARYVPFGDGREVIMRRGREMGFNYGAELSRRTVKIKGHSFPLVRTVAILSPPPLRPDQFVSFIMGMPLDFKPGTDAKYSNVGYVILGEVIAKVSGQSYDRFVTENVLKPIGMKRIGLHSLDSKYLDNEARRTLAGTTTILPPMQMPMVDAAGGWTASAVDMVRFLTNLDGSGGKSVLSEKSRQLMIEPPSKPIKPRADGTFFGLGWDMVWLKDKTFSYIKTGSYQGIRTYMKRLPTGVNWAMLFNTQMELDQLDGQIIVTTVREVHQIIDRFEKYPDVDLFKEFP